MDQTQMVKQIIQMNKLVFDSNYNMIMSAYEQNKLVLGTMLAQATGLPPEAKSAIEEWLKTYKRGCEDLKDMIDQGYQMVEKAMAESPS